MPRTIVFLLSLFLSTNASALTYEFSGSWTGNYPLSGNFSGSINYDPATLTSHISSTSTTYFSADFSIDVFDSGTTVITFPAVIAVTDNDPLLGDIVQFGLADLSGMPQASGLSALLGTTVIGFSVDFIDSTSSAIGDESVPMIIDPSAFTSQALAFRYYENGFPDLQLGAVSAFGVPQGTSVPEPGTWAMLLLGLAGLTGVLRRGGL